MKISSSKLLLITIVGVTMMAWVFWPKTTRNEPGNSGPKKDSRPAQNSPSATVLNHNSSQREASLNEIYIHDRSSIGDRLLVSKTRSENSEANSEINIPGDLWLQDEEGNERLITSEAIWAKFSPDGGKIAYVSNSGELFIQTSQGEALAHLQNVSDPNWHTDSATLSFQAIPSDDYPDFRQTFVYDLKADKVVKYSADDVRSN